MYKSTVAATQPIPTPQQKEIKEGTIRDKIPRPTFHHEVEAQATPRMTRDAVGGGAYRTFFPCSPTLSHLP